MWLRASLLQFSKRVSVFKVYWEVLKKALTPLHAYDNKELSTENFPTKMAQSYVNRSFMGRFVNKRVSLFSYLSSSPLFLKDKTQNDYSSLLFTSDILKAKLETTTLHGCFLPVSKNPFGQLHMERLKRLAEPANETAHTGSRTRVTNMGGLYDAATLCVLVEWSSGRH